jgi:hypothetical protein
MKVTSMSVRPNGSTRAGLMKTPFKTKPPQNYYCYSSSNVARRKELCYGVDTYQGVW